jgi:hypothetical protein
LRSVLPAHAISFPLSIPLQISYQTDINCAGRKEATFPYLQKIELAKYNDMNPAYHKEQEVRCHKTRKQQTATNLQTRQERTTQDGTGNKESTQKSSKTHGNAKVWKRKGRHERRMAWRKEENAARDENLSVPCASSPNAAPENANDKYDEKSRHRNERGMRDEEVETTWTRWRGTRREGSGCDKGRIGDGLENGQRRDRR